MEEVILVDELDRPIGRMEKMEAHRKALLHRAFSVFILNDRGELMLQQRAFDKYHSGGLWTNTCCSHPRPDEPTVVAGERGLIEEMGFTTPLKEIFQFTYKARLDNELTEYEFDHVLLGHYNDEPRLNEEEAVDYRRVALPAVEAEIKEHPEQFSEWFKICFEPFFDHMKRPEPQEEI